jgi:hypothetical protein
MELAITTPALLFPAILIIDDFLHDTVSSPGQPGAEFTRPKTGCSRAYRS